MVVLVATLNTENVPKLIEDMNLMTVDTIVINQSSTGREGTVIEQSQQATIVHSERLGLSASRNEAISYAQSEDICQIADDDMIFVDNYQEIVENAYKEFPDADIIVFGFDFQNHPVPKKKLRKGKLGYLASMRVVSFQICFKKSSLMKVGIKFDERFGIGAKYGSGEENILLYDALRNGLKVYCYPEKIGKLVDRESHWDRSPSPTLCYNRGAIFRRMTNYWYWLLIVQFAIRKRKQMLPEISLFDNIRYMFQGAREFSRLK